MRQQTIWDALLHRLQVEVPAGAAGAAGQTAPPFLPLLRGVRRGGLMGARGMPRGPQGRGVLHRRAAPRGAAGPFPRGNGRVDKERKRNPKRRAVWRPKSRCTGENGGAVGAGKFFAGQLPTKTQKGLIFEAKMSRMEAAANLLAQSVCIGGTECKFCPERGIMPEETTSASCMFEEDKQNTKNKNTLRSEPKPMKRKVLAVLLSLCMLLPLLPVAAFAAENLTFGEGETAKTFKPVPTERMTFREVEGTEMEVTDGAVTYTITATESKDWVQNSGVGSNQAYTYVGLYVTMPEGAVSLKRSFEGDPENMGEVAADFLKDGKYASWYPVAEGLGENGGAPFSLFSGGQEYTLLLEWYDAEGKPLESEYVKVTRELAEELVVAQTDDGLKYATLTGAVDAVVESEDKTGEVTLRKDSEGSAVGLFVDEGASEVDLTIDFGGFTYTCNDPAAGSPGTETQSFHLEKGNTVTLKNGTIKVAEDSKKCLMLIQNYCDLTLEDLTLIGSDVTSYLISSNYGDVVLRNVNVSGSNKNLIAAIDLMHWLNNSYRDKAPTLTIENSEENLIAGPIDVYCWKDGTGRVTCEEKPTLTVLGGTFTAENVEDYLSTDYAYRDNEDGTWTVVEAEGLVAKAESNGSNATASVGGSFAGNQSGDGVEADETTVEVSVTTGAEGAQDDTVTSSAVTISANAMASIEGSTVKTVDIKTDVATLSVDSDAWSTMAEAHSAVTLTVSVADERGEGGKLVYTLTAKDESGDDVFTESTGSITVSVDYGAGKENTPVVYYLSDKGVVQLDTVTYDKETGALSWSVNHFSDYEVADNAYVASVTDDGTTTTYATVEEALEAVAASGGTVNLLVDEATVGSLSLTISGDVVIKGTGTIDVTVEDVDDKNTSVFTIENTGSLTLDGVKMVVNGVQNEGQGSDGTAFTLYGNADGVGSEVFVINGGELDLRNLNKGFIMGGPAPSTAKVTVKNGVLNASGIDGNFSNGGEFVFDHAVVNIEAGVDDSIYAGHALSVHKLTATASKITASASKYGLNITDPNGEVKLLEDSTLEVKDSGTKFDDGTAAANMQKGSTLVVDKTSTLSVTGTNNKLHLDEEGTSVLLGTVEADMNTVPYIYAVGFKANAADANETINKLFTELAQLVGAANDPAPITDSDDNTMFVLFTGTGTADTYTLTVTDEDGAEVYDEDLVATKGGVIYFTFEQQNSGSPTKKPIASGTYTLEVKNSEDKVVGTTAITLAKVSFEPDGGGDAPAAFYGAAGDTVTLPADKPTKTGYNFAGWKNEDGGEDAETFKAGADYTMGSDDVTLTAQWNRRNSGGGAPSGGGGSAVTEYAVTVSTADNGSVAVSPKNAEKGDTVTVTVTPDEGYVLESLTVTDKDGDKVSTTKGEDGKYTFTMPGSTVTVKAVFAEEGTVSELPFEDVKVEQWFYEAVKYVYDNELMNGISATEFNPNGLLTRGTIAQVLFNLEGADADAAAVFDDVPADAWFADAVNWAAANNIVTGYGDGTFGPDNNITREQMAAILYRYAQFKGYDVSAKGDLTAFTDGDNVSEWATDALAWCVGAKLINGRDNGTVDATGTATRAEIAQIFMNFCENIAK